MSKIQINGDSIEFTGSVDDFKKEIAKKFSKRKVSARQMAEEQNLTIKTLYNWAHRYGSYRRMTKKTSLVQKMKYILLYDALKDEERGALLRKLGLRDEEIASWKNEILTQEEIEPIIPLSERNEELRRTNVTLKLDLKRTKQMLSAKGGEVIRIEKKLKEAEALVEIKKKAEILFGKKEKD